MNKGGSIFAADAEGKLKYHPPIFSNWKSGFVLLPATAPLGALRTASFLATKLRMAYVLITRY